MDILMTAFFHCGLNSQQRMKYGRHPKKIREHNGSRFVTTTSKCDVRKKKTVYITDRYSVRKLRE